MGRLSALESGTMLSKRRAGGHDFPASEVQRVWPHFVAKGQGFPQNPGVARPVLPGRASAHGGTRPAVPHTDLQAASMTCHEMRPHPAGSSP